MKLEISRSRILIEPETDQDVAFIEDTLGLAKEGNYLKLVRENKLAKPDLLWLSTSTETEKEEVSKKHARRKAD